MVVVRTAQRPGQDSPDELHMVGRDEGVDDVHRFAFPRFRAAGLKAMVTVQPLDAHARLAARNWAHHARTWRFDQYEAASLDDARGILRAGYRDAN